MFQDSGIKDKVAIVTGGSRGIGRAIVKLLALEGAHVNFFYHQNQTEAESLVAELQQQGFRVQAWKCDVRDRKECEALTEEINSHYERIDILVNNSGIVQDGLLVGLESADIQNVLATNVLGVFNVSKSVVPYMMSKRSGNVINISSVAAVKPGRGQSNYAASKGAVNSFTTALAVELASRNIRVNAVAPGVIETDMTQSVREMGGEEALSKILLKRYGKPEEVANVVLFLASRHSSYINGAIINVDGGFKMA